MGSAGPGPRSRLLAEVGEEVAAGWAVLRELARLARPVVADGGGGDEHLRALLGREAVDRLHDELRGVEAARDELFLNLLIPARADRGACEWGRVGGKVSRHMSIDQGAVCCGCVKRLTGKVHNTGGALDGVKPAELAPAKRFDQDQARPEYCCGSRSTSLGQVEARQASDRGSRMRT